VTGNGTGNGTINANYSENTSVSQRVANITVTVSGLPSQTVTVTQAASSVGINDVTSSDLQVYPNPTRGLIKFKAGSLKNQVLEVSIMDISGKKILNRTCSGSEEYSFDISKEPKGFYFIRINTETSTQIRKFMLID
jgi:hypothetical protein